MIVLRLTRVGKRKQPTYRLVAQQKHNDPWGKSFEILGSYNPRTKAKDFDTAKIQAWIAKGAQPSGAVHNLLIDSKIIEGKKMAVTGKVSGKKPEEAAKA
jgi:small subunit ribosomal protein S16